MFDKLKSAYDSVSAFISGKTESVKNTSSKIVENVKTATTEAVKTVTEKGKAIYNNTMDAVASVPKAVTGLLSGLGSFGKFIPVVLIGGAFFFIWRYTQK